ncbi:hypothetical protein [Roseibacillus persicicus]|uniref:hypothetical protein n=1 Tax=Roseibacillus persicicus TaxID=454148 RepID=UPI00280FD015|nr:hypothetical protein [Roseibacillus persicicus]MDQ8192575.1 hypothetical protein [Roseibacillus persicicus]
MKLQHYLYTAGLALALPTAAQDKVEPAATTAPTTNPDSKAVTEGRVGYVYTEESETMEERVARLEKEVEEREAKLKSLLKELDEAKETVETTKETAEGNANHARDLIEAESELLTKRLERLSDSIKNLQKHHTERAYKKLEDSGSFSYDDKMTFVQNFLDSANTKVDNFIESLSLEEPKESVDAVEEKAH